MTRWVGLTCDVLGGKNSKEKAGEPAAWASASFLLICMMSYVSVSSGKSAKAYEDKVGGGMFLDVVHD